jgi:hypothetical protein
MLAAGTSCVAALLIAGEASAEPAPSSPSPENATPAIPPPQDVRRVPLPDESLGYEPVLPRPTLLWAAFQLLPSPEIAVGSRRHIEASGRVDEGTMTAFGLRWQLTPVLWSFGVHRSQSRWRWFVVDPLARQSGSLELSTSFEYIGGHVDRVLARPGLRVYLPLVAKGEYLSASLGTSVYAYDGTVRAAYDAGIYLFAGFLGLQVTVAPVHAPLAAITTFRLRYF